MNPIPIILWGALTIGCFGLCAKGFSEDGIPLTKNKMIKGTTGKVLGAICGVLGLAFGGFLILIILAQLARAGR